MNLLPSVYLVRNNVLLGFESQRLEFLTGFALALPPLSHWNPVSWCEISMSFLRLRKDKTFELERFL